MAKITSLAPKDPAKNKALLAKHVSILVQIRAYTIAVEQTNLVSAISPNPAWYNTLSTNLDAAKKHSTIWTQTLEPAIVSTIPQAVLNLGTRYDLALGAILKILSDSNNKPTPAQVTTITGKLSWASRNVGREQTSIKEVQTQFSTFQKNATTDLTTLTTGNNSIQKAISDDKNVVANLKADIVKQNIEITKDHAVIEAAAIAAGVGLFVGVSAIALGAAASGPAAPIAIVIGTFIIVGSLVELATILAVYETRIADAQSALNTDTQELSAENTQIASLTVMNNSIGSLVDKNKAMANSLSDVANWFKLLDTKIGTVISELKEASSDMNAADWADFSMDLQLAQTDWKDFASFAQGMEQSVTNIQSKVVNIAPKKAA